MAQLVIFSDLPTADEAKALSRVSVRCLRSAYLQKKKGGGGGDGGGDGGGTRVGSLRPDLKRTESYVAQIHERKEKEEKTEKDVLKKNLKKKLYIYCIYIIYTVYI